MYRELSQVNTSPSQSFTTKLGPFCPAWRRSQCSKFPEHCVRTPPPKERDDVALSANAPTMRSIENHCLGNYACGLEAAVQTAMARSALKNANHERTPMAMPTAYGDQRCMRKYRILPPFSNASPSIRVRVAIRLFASRRDAAGLHSSRYPEPGQ